MKDRLIVALDFDDIKKAASLVGRLYPAVKIFKVGSQLFTAYGPDAIKMVHKKGAKVFLDLKFHDIPNTVAGALKAAIDMNVFMVNIHASGGAAMIAEAVAAKKSKRYPLILAVTVLTSMDKESLVSIGVNDPAIKQVRRLALLAKTSGADGVVCSAQEAATIRKLCGGDFVIVTPGIRPADSRAQDQKRIETPRNAIISGADYIVVGRPIAQAKDPAYAARSVLDEIKSAYRK